MAEPRIAQYERKTAETEITVEINLDGTGQAEVETGIGFFDHMLTHIARHGLFDLKIKAKGDLWIDDHHTVEDVGICLGEALARAVGDKAGMVRFGNSILPMDEALVLVALDFSGRPLLMYDAEIRREKVGDFATEMVPEFFRALSVHAGITLHIQVLSGDNAHHIVEATFKSFARALSAATRTDPRIHGVLSTKGSID